VTAALSRLRALAMTVALVAAPRMALACPVCFGNSDAPMAKATNTGILFMVGMVAAVLCGFASFIIYLVVRANRAASAEAARADARGFTPSEGTAQC
jgi:heme/copper-type cytochrome/quinol oxidase subunit 2